MNIDQTSLLVNTPVSVLTTVWLSVLTFVLYQVMSWVQQKLQIVWLHPLILTCMVLIPALLFYQVDYQSYREATRYIHIFLEPATVALGFPLYQQINTILRHWKPLVSLLALGVIIVLTVSLSMTMLLLHQTEVAIALSLKSVTTPIGITLTDQLLGDSSITPFAITIAGLSGGLLGPAWLRFIKVQSPVATGLAIGSASHVIGSIILIRHNPIAGAYSSVALILSGVLTAFISPLLIPALMPYLL